jgi:hypothetical protein
VRQRAASVAAALSMTLAHPDATSEYGGLLIGGAKCDN